MKKHKLYRVIMYINNLHFTAITTVVLAYNISDSAELAIRRIASRFIVDPNDIKIRSVEEIKQ